MLLTTVVLCAALRGATVRAPAPRMQVSVQLARLLPMMPVVAPDAQAQRVLQFDGAVAPTQLAWVQRGIGFTGSVARQRSVDRLAFVVGGSQWTWAEGGVPEQLQPDAAVDSHSVSAPGLLTTVGGQKVYLRDADSGAATPLVSLDGLAVNELIAVSGNRMLLSAADGRLLLLEQDEGQEGLGGIGARPPEWELHELAAGLGSVRGMCVSSNERALYLSVGTEVLRAPMRYISCV